MSETPKRHRWPKHDLAGECEYTDRCLDCGLLKRAPSPRPPCVPSAFELSATTTSHKSAMLDAIAAVRHVYTHDDDALDELLSRRTPQHMWHMYDATQSLLLMELGEHHAGSCDVHDDCVLGHFDHWQYMALREPDEAGA